MSITDSSYALHAAHALLRDNRTAEGLQALTVLANQNNAQAAFDLGNALLMFATDAARIGQGLQRLRQAEAAGYAPAAYRMAYTSLVEVTETFDWRVLAERLAFCCRQQHPNALCDAAVFFARFGTPAQQRASTGLLELAALRGSTVAMALLGERLAIGTLCDADPARANSIRRIAAQLGMPVPPPDPQAGFAPPEPATPPPAFDDWDFSALPAAVAAEPGVCLDGPTQLYLHTGFLSDEECLYIKCLGGPDVAPSVSVDDNGRQQLNQIRTSHDFAFLPEFEQVYLNLLQRRMAAAAGLPLRQAEPLILLRYTPGQEYRPHRDVLPPSHFIPVEAGGAGQRLRTVIAYLNTPEAGGETAFPLLERTIAAEQGRIARFDSLDADGGTCRTSLHAGMPVKQGVKWICTLWFRQRTHRML